MSMESGLRLGVTTKRKLQRRTQTRSPLADNSTHPVLMRPLGTHYTLLCHSRPLSMTSFNHDGFLKVSQSRPICRWRLLGNLRAWCGVFPPTSLYHNKIILRNGVCVSQRDSHACHRVTPIRKTHPFLETSPPRFLLPRKLEGTDNV